jgi:hypothetical protein
MAAERDGRKILKSPAKFAERRPRARYDHGWHKASLRGGKSPK